MMVMLIEICDVDSDMAVTVMVMLIMKGIDKADYNGSLCTDNDNYDYDDETLP